MAAPIESLASWPTAFVRLSLGRVGNNCHAAIVFMAAPLACFSLSGMVAGCRHLPVPGRSAINLGNSAPHIMEGSAAWLVFRLWLFHGFALLDRRILSR